ncbi:MAG: phosphoribosylformylglycinamidine cyclo-ligase [Campylobacteraceae bacterium 4484_166]|nr:MAG: phosphoribosylformylglycinamidine cyclo-ligase [Campylobacteraceae bacterium 4484_166]
MKKSQIIVGLLFLSLLVVGCDNKTKVAKEQKVDESISQKSETVDTNISKNQAKQANMVAIQVFNDVAKVGPNGKPMILVFGTNTDPYSMKLKEDIFKSKELQSRLKGEFSSYYFKAHENLRHKLFHEGEYMDVDTKTMINIYGITATPTLIFTDDKGKAVIIVPGYMPTKQFLVTLDFMLSNKWVGKGRKDGEVYEELKKFYIKNNIEVSKK